MSSHLIDLTSLAGLQVMLNADTGELHFAENVKSDPPTARILAELRPVLREPFADGPDPAIRLYRAVRHAEDEELLRITRLRYDLTVTLPGIVGDEYMKTTGHYHTRGTEGVSFPEVYEVIYGKAAFLLQHVHDVEAKYPEVDDVWVQICHAGDRIVIPPGCGHVTINIGTVPLVVSDLISQFCGHLYESFKDRRGAAYYVVAAPGTANGLRLEPNLSYSGLATPSVGHGSRCAPFLGLDHPVYTYLRDTPGSFAFLERPAASVSQLRSLWPGR